MEPQTTGPGAREELRKWRLETPLDTFTKVRKQWNDAGIELYAYNLSFNNSFTDAEIDRGFEMAKAMGVKVLTATSTVSAAKKVAPFADKHKIQVAMHGHDNLTDPEQFAKPESFAAALEMSKYFMINLDIGHFVSAGYDPVEYLKQHHDRIVDLHIKDRTKAHANLPVRPGRNAHQGGAAAAPDQQVEDPGQHRIRIQGDGCGGGSQEVLPVHERSPGVTGTQTPTRVRYWVIVFAATLAVVTYIDRVALSFAAPFISKDLGLDSRHMGLAFTAFGCGLRRFRNPRRIPGRPPGTAQRAHADRAVVEFLHRRHGLHLELPLHRDHAVSLWRGRSRLLSRT